MIYAYAWVCVCVCVRACVMCILITRMNHEFSYFVLIFLFWKLFRGCCYCCCRMNRFGRTNVYRLSTPCVHTYSSLPSLSMCMLNSFDLNFRYELAHMWCVLDFCFIRTKKETKIWRRKESEIEIERGGRQRRYTRRCIAWARFSCRGASTRCWFFLYCLCYCRVCLGLCASKRYYVLNAAREKRMNENQKVKEAGRAQTSVLCVCVCAPDRMEKIHERQKKSST